MLKSFILAATSISYILSAVNIADAMSNHGNNCISKNCHNLIANLPASTNRNYPSKADIEGIYQAIAESIKNGNIASDPNNKDSKFYKSKEGLASFKEATKLRLISFKDNSAVVAVYVTRKRCFIFQNWKVIVYCLSPQVKR
jgi:hypothetical protein